MLSKPTPSTSFMHGEQAYTILGYAEGDDIYKRIVAKRDFYEIAVLDKIQELDIQGVYIDVGANIGNHSIFFLNECRASCVVAIEANTDLIPILCRNIQSNNPKGKPVIILHELITTHQRVFFHKSDTSDNIGMSYFSLTNHDGSGEDRDGTTLDDVARAIPTVDQIGLIKIDVEGQELDVLQSAAGLIREHHPFLVVEVFSQNYEMVKHHLRENGYLLLRQLKGANYVFGYCYSARSWYFWLRALLHSLVYRVNERFGA